MDQPSLNLPNTASRLIAMAVSLLGSPEEVRACLDCSVPDFEAYCDGRKEPPWPEVDRLVALIIREQRAAIRKSCDA